MKYNVFLSHSSKNADIASELCEFLESNGKKCFIAPRDIRFGMEYAEEIVNGIDESEAMILILSKDSNESPHVLREIERAVSKGIPIIVYRIEEVQLSKSLEYFLMTNQWMDAMKMSDYNNILVCVNQVLDKDNAKTLSKTAVGEKKKFGNGSKRIGVIGGIIAVVIVALLIVIIMKLPSDDNKKDDKNVSVENTETYGDKENISNEPDENSVGKLENIKLGDTVVFGNYFDEGIEWRVLKISDDEKNAVLITKDIICMKSYDAAEGGMYNQDEEGNSYYKQESEADTNQELQINVRGNSDWSKSNIREWLNSSDEVVKYQDQAPAVSTTSDHKNGYNNEPGFLYGFTEEELAAIVETENVTAGNKISEEKEIKTKDKVYLLSMEQMDWFEEAGISELAKPTQAAIDNDESNWYDSEKEAYSVDEYVWWLREPVKECSSKCYMVGNGYDEENILEKNVGLEGFGIRPAVTVDIELLERLVK